MEDFLDRISRDPLLREAVRSQLGLSIVSMEGSPSHVRVINPSDALSVSSQLASISSQCVVYTSNSMNQQAGIADTLGSHQSDSNNSPLAARVHQSGSILNDSLAALVRQGEVSDAMNPNGGHQIDTNNDSSASPSDFDPPCYTADDEYTFESQSAITNYIEKHFKSTLDKTSRSAMHKEHSVPSTPAIKAPKVNRFVTDYLKATFPRSDYAELMKVQSALLKV